jgi:hypothetical protein
MNESPDHRTLAEALRQKLVSAAAQTDATLRQAAMTRVAGGAPLPEPYDALVRQIGEASTRVTDAQVAAVKQAAGSDKAAFEVVMAAAIGAGLLRWDKAMEALDAAS